MKKFILFILYIYVCLNTESSILSTIKQYERELNFHINELNFLSHLNNKSEGLAKKNIGSKITVNKIKIAYYEGMLVMAKNELKNLKSR